MLKQLIDEKSNEIFVLQTAGKGTSCPACVWQTVLHAGTAVHTADKWQPALSLSRAHVYLTLWLYPILFLELCFGNLVHVHPSVIVNNF